MSSDALSGPAIRVAGLSKNYLIYGSPQDRLKQSLWCGRRQFYKEFQALKDVSFEVPRGHTIGIIGRNGSGKSTLLQILCGTVTPTSGECVVNGRVSALLELGAGFNPEFTGRENIYLNGAILGLKHAEINEKYDSIVEFSGIGDKVEQQVKTYSSGMYVRLAFAVAVASDPDILIVDEALAVGDEMFQRKCYARIRTIQENGGTILFVSHAGATIVEICDRALLLDQGELLMEGTPKQVIGQYHKLIYAPDDKLVALRARIKAGAGEEEPVIAATSAEPLQQAGSELFDPAMMPESTISYEEQGAHISSIHITTESGERANNLTRGQRYRFRYTVEFKEAACGVRFGMLIKTKSGIELGGSSTATEETAIPFVDSGTVMQVQFNFHCLLFAGTYFMNCGCSAIIDGTRVFLHRMVDSCMFRVMPERDTKTAGIIDFQIESVFQEKDKYE